MMLFCSISSCFLICQDNPSEKDINQGILVVSNLDSSVSNDELHQIFGFFGEIKEVNGLFYFILFFPLVSCFNYNRDEGCFNIDCCIFFLDS